MNAPDSDRYREIDAANMNKPRAQLRCPRCESANVRRDPDSSHPGVFECADCGEGFCA